MIFLMFFDNTTIYSYLDSKGDESDIVKMAADIQSDLKSSCYLGQKWH